MIDLPETFINPRALAVTTITHFPRWYPGKLLDIKDTDKIRGDLSLELIQKAKHKGHRVVVVDGGGKRFHAALKQIKGITILYRQSPKRSPRRRLAYRVAAKIAGVKVILATEPEKVDLIDSVPNLARPILQGKADIVVPKRNDRLFKQSYPSFQYHLEITGSTQYNRILRRHGFLTPHQLNIDWFFGPKLFANKKEILKLFLKRFTFTPEQLSHAHAFDTEDYANALYFPVVLALQKKLRISSRVANFRYPKLQRQNELATAKTVFIPKRRAQRRSLLAQLTLFLRATKSTR